MPGQGTRSMLTIGFGYGLWLGILATLRLPYTTVRPAVWKRSMGLNRDERNIETASHAALPWRRAPAKSITAALRPCCWLLWAAVAHSSNAPLCSVFRRMGRPRKFTPCR